MKRPVPVESASAFIDEKIKELGDWRGKTLAKVREIIHGAPSTSTKATRSMRRSWRRRAAPPIGRRTAWRQSCASSPASARSVSEKTEQTRILRSGG